MRPGTVSLCLLIAVLIARSAFAQATPQGTQPATPADTQPVGQTRISCQSERGDRTDCPADASSGVTLVKSAGSLGATTTAAQLRRRVGLDLMYIDNWSLWLDLKILVRTVRAVTTGEGSR